MDMGLFRDEDRFATYCMDYSNNENILDDSSNNSNDFWEFDQEQELNGDLALIPVTSALNDSFHMLSNSPPIKEDFNKIMSDWQQYINLENVGGVFESIAETAVEMHRNHFDDLNITNAFDITSYINEPEPTNFETKPNVSHRMHGAPVKKIDLEAQRYIVENDNDPEDDVDVETVSDCGNSPVLEAGDIKSLLEQFEATELPDMSNNLLNISIPSIDDSSLDLNHESLDVNKSIQETLDVSSNDKKDLSNLVVTKEFDPEDFLQKDPPENVVVDKVVNSIQKEMDNVEPIKTETKEETSKIVKSPIKTLPKTNATSTKTTSTTSASTDASQNNAILNQLPKELIDRIKESGKRKPISVIPPMPSKKRGNVRSQESGIQMRGLKMGVKPPDTVKLDHDYCTVQTNYSKNPKKDSGFESSEDDDRVNIKHQPIVKNTDGTLMVSLLKVNTIHHESVKKRKLNLEEYKKRRTGLIRLKTPASTSQSCSPLSSACSSPTPEDEHLRRLKHQEKLMKMAKEVLNAAPKSETLPNCNNNPTIVQPEPVEEIIPPDMIKKTIVSIGVNTDFITIDQDFKKGHKDRLAPVHQLEEIKPLLAKVSGQINRNSLITSVIENIPKVLTSSSSKPPDNNVNNTDNKTQEHGEDKTILFLPKVPKNPVKTVSTGVQTNISLLTGNKQRRYRRRNSSISSTSSESSVENNKVQYSRRRKLSNSSTYSDSSSSSSSYAYSRSSSRSRSRSISPRPPKKNRSMDREHLKEVEERRVIYVGRIAINTTKEDLKNRFIKFGPITNISLHFRDHGDNYGFVTFAKKYDAYEAIEHGNDDPYLPKYDISFGGRRLFCQTSYSDLDNVRDESTYFQQRPDDSFDKLLKEAQEKLRKRKA